MTSADIQQGNPCLQNKQNSFYTINCAAPGSCSNRPQCWSCRNLSPCIIPFKLMGLCLKSVELSICVLLCCSRPRGNKSAGRVPCCSDALCYHPSNSSRSGRMAPEDWAEVSKEKPCTGEVAQWFTEWHPFLWVSLEQKSQHSFKMGNYSWICLPLEEMENKHPAHVHHTRSL